MSYFLSNHSQVDLFTNEDGLRAPQLGAVGALIAHGTKSIEPAVISLPTGTGKTAVLQLAPFLWKASRVLVITPSRVVREQITKGFTELELLRSLGVLSDDLNTPKVRSILKRIVDNATWEECRGYDVVVSTPQSCSPAIEQIPAPAPDLFDLILIDEAHHSPAVSYAAILDAFPDAKKAFFTATPFRRDKKALRGKLVYNYPLRSAIEDGTYGKIQFLPCEPSKDESHDLAIAKLAETTFRSDCDSGLDHRMMVRTDSVIRAKELVKVYQEHTSLKLKLVYGNHAMSHVNGVVRKLKSGELDGIICVDMFGEGVDFPNLKLAALHAPHKSLAVTLQFIGRFARTNADGIGTAKFIAVPMEIDAEVRELYKNGASWEDLVANLADARVEEEEEVREGLSSFETEHTTDTDEVDLTIDSLNPYFHVKVLQTDREPDFQNNPFVPRGCELIFHAVSDDLSAAVIVCQRKQKPKWLLTPALHDTKNILFVIHYDRFNQLLFINSQEHGEDAYENIVDSLYPEDSDEVCMPLPHGRISRALRMLKKPCFYNVGMRNRELGSQDESYRTLTGSKADRGVNRTDANKRSRGHVFGGSTAGDESCTLGVSTLSKLWSNKYGLVPLFVGWCQALAVELSDDSAVVTDSNLDLLDTGQQTDAMPAHPIGIVWNEHVYRYPQLINIAGTTEDRDLSGLELSIDGSTFNPSSVEFELIMDESSIARYRFSLADARLISRVDDGPKLTIRGQACDGSLAELMSIRPPTIFLADFSTIVGRDWYRGTTGSPLDHSTIQTFDDFGKTVDIEREVSGARNDTVSIHDFTKAQFLAGSSDVVIYDHRTNEIADLISLSETNSSILCKVAHCKGASGKKNKSKPKTAGARVDDVYEVAGQVVKCLPYSNRPDELKEKLLRRLSSGSALLRGTTELMERILDNASHKKFEFQVCLVQPGISKTKLNESLETVLAAASEYVSANAGLAPEIWTSP